MGTKRELRKHAPELLEASNQALQYLFRQGTLELASEEEERQRVMAVLRDAIELADPPIFDESAASIKLVMTPTSWSVLRKLLEERASLGRDDRVALDACLEGVKESKQRVYLKLSINPLVLRKLKWVLDHQAPSAQDTAFARMSEQIEKDGLSKNPMEILAEQGL
jgi:hypothetical protein